MNKYQSFIVYLHPSQAQTAMGEADNMGLQGWMVAVNAGEGDRYWQHDDGLGYQVTDLSGNNPGQGPQGTCTTTGGSSWEDATLTFNIEGRIASKNANPWVLSWVQFEECEPFPTEGPPEDC